MVENGKIMRKAGVTVEQNAGKQVKTTEQEIDREKLVERKPHLDTEGKLRRPFSVTLLAYGVLSIAGLNLLRFLGAVSNWGYLTSLPGVSPLYQAISGLFWIGLSLPVAIFLWTGRPGTPRVTLFFSLLYALYSWLDRLLLAHNSLRASYAYEFHIGLTIFLLGFVLWVLFLSKAKNYFRR